MIFPSEFDRQFYLEYLSGERTIRASARRCRSCIAALALKDDLLTESKIGILTGSAISAILGCALLVAFLPRKAVAVAEPVPTK